MKARRKSDGKIIEVREWRGASDVVYSEPDMNRFYQAPDLDFNVDAEGEEMLTVSRKDIVELYQEVQKTIDKYQCTHLGSEAVGKREVLRHLFGSKCLPDEERPKQKDCDNPLADKEGCRWRNDGKCAFDSACYFEPPLKTTAAEDCIAMAKEEMSIKEEPKPAEPKFKVGNVVRYRYDGKLYIVEGKTGKYHYALRQHYGNIMMHDVLGSDLEPYTEPREDVNLSQETANCDKHSNNTLTDTRNAEIDHFVVKDEMVDNIIKDGFKNHNRLHIAAIIAAGWIAHDGIMDPDILAADSLTIADILIAKSEKGDE